ncbi:Serine phosphatase RsbU, regulator of sigma subunit [Tropicimonas isoalkanivorans]|uniref:Serine phosphatase RsbU, regulator of sigma subunit n=1 Tax=Tropicimonas isoalkanivorans TaxID=441112 RepID=A0A1I1M5Y7_9RHOB|nr:Serine phosphatase RsbU, regulator of sigma subunit [Tropicimonas isoalkanivorans]
MPTACESISVIPEGGRLLPRCVMVVDDSRLQRRILSALLNRWGYCVEEAESAPQALEKCSINPPDIVISDWMMPQMNGLEFCRAFRRMQRDTYGYFILLTSKSQSLEVVQGLDAGADDFLTKPVNGDELRARLNAGERVLSMEKELVDKNALLTSTLQELQTLYDSLDSDLTEARKLQQSLVRERFRDFGGSQISLLLRPSGHVGGDLVGFFPINAHRIAAFAIDVAGHGVASALMTARLAGFLSSTSPDQNVALFESEYGIYDAHPPEEVAAQLNALMLTELETETYFTLLLADIDLVSGDVRLVQAGHPYPAVQRADGSVEFLGRGGHPVGLFPEARFEPVVTRLAPGDRLFISSDGVTECESPDGKMLDTDGLVDLLGRNRSLRGPDFMESLVWDLARFGGEQEFSDDVSAVLFEFNAPKCNVD